LKPIRAACASGEGAGGGLRAAAAERCADEGEARDQHRPGRGLVEGKGGWVAMSSGVMWGQKRSVQSSALCLRRKHSH